MDLSAKSGLRWLSAILSDAGVAAPESNFLVVGAIARDLLLHYGYGVPIRRATTDVDLGIAVASWEEFQRLREAYLGSGSFTAGQRGNHRLVHRSGVTIDLIPFGSIEREDGTIVWPGDDTVMGVLGFREARVTAVGVVLPGEVTAATVCLPMLAILKLVAWSERHTYAPRRDASDLFLVLKNYLNGENAARLYEVGAHLLESDDFDYDVAGAWLAGHDSARCIIGHSDHPGRVLSAVNDILSAETDADGRLRLVGETGQDAENTLKLLAGFRDGLNYVLS